jgi:hypothetical protein
VVSRIAACETIAKRETSKRTRAGTKERARSPERGEIATLHNKTLSAPIIADTSGRFRQRSGFQVW